MPESILAMSNLMVIGVVSLTLLWAFKTNAFKQKQLERQRQLQHQLEQEEQRLQEHRAQEEQRLRDLVSYFGEQDGERIWRHDVWKGQTYEQLIASKGTPLQAEKKVLRTKTVHTLKYSCGVREVTLDDGVVVGWVV